MTSLNLGLLGAKEGLARPRAGECSLGADALYGCQTERFLGDALTETNSPGRGAVGRGPAALRALTPGQATPTNTSQSINRWSIT